MSSGLQAYNEQQKLGVWAEKVSQCRESGMSVRQWCQKNGVNISSYYKWQRKLYALTKVQQTSEFAEITPRQSAVGIAVTVQINGVELQIHNGADVTTVESVLRILRSC